MVDYLVQGAADWELEPLICALVARTERKCGIWTFWSGIVGETSVVVSRTDWGPINAVAATIVGIQEFQPRAVICQGMAGAHNPELQVGDVIVGERAVDHSAYKAETAPAGGGVQLSLRTPLAHRLRVPGDALTAFDFFPGAPAIVEAALKVPNPHGRVLKGTVGSGYQYNRELDCITAIRAMYGTDCEDMESAFAAGASAAMAVSFAAIRMISNSEWNHPKLDKSAGARCAEFVAALVARGLRRPE